MKNLIHALKTDSLFLVACSAGVLMLGGFLTLSTPTVSAVLLIVGGWLAVIAAAWWSIRGILRFLRNHKEANNGQ